MCKQILAFRCIACILYTQYKFRKNKMHILRKIWKTEYSLALCKMISLNMNIQVILSF